MLEGSVNIVKKWLTFAFSCDKYQFVWGLRLILLKFSQKMKIGLIFCFSSHGQPREELVELNAELLLLDEEVERSLTCKYTINPPP